MKNNELRWDQFWWCKKCQMIVEPKHVTFEEHHDPRYGGCNNTVSELPETIKSIMNCSDYWKRHFKQALTDIEYLKNKLENIEKKIKKECEININLY